MFDDIELHKLLSGGRTSDLPIARLSTKIATIIGAKTNTVLLSPYTARKQRFKHGKIGHIILSHYRLVQTIIDDGEVIHKPDRPKHLEFLYRDRVVFQTNFIVVIKANERGNEIFLESFRKIGKRRFNPRVRQAHKNGHVVRYLKP